MNVSKYLLFNSHSRPPSFPSPPPLSTTFLCFSLLTCLPLFFLNVTPANSTVHLNLIIHFLLLINLLSTFLVIFLPQLLYFFRVITWPFCPMPQASITRSIPPLNISNNLCPLHFQHCFFSTSSNTISPHGNPVLSSLQMFTQLFFLILHPHTWQYILIF